RSTVYGQEEEWSQPLAAALGAAYGPPPGRPAPAPPGRLSPRARPAWAAPGARKPPAPAGAGGERGGERKTGEVTGNERPARPAPLVPQVREDLLGRRPLLGRVDRL